MANHEPDDLEADWQQLQRDHFRQPSSTRRTRDPRSPADAEAAAALRAQRARRRLSQRALAELLGDGFSRGIIARWEAHGPPRGRWLGRLVRLAAFFEVSTDAMLGYHPRPRTLWPRPDAPVIQIGTINFYGGTVNCYWGAQRSI